MTFEKLLALVKLFTQFIKDILGAISGGGVPAGAQASVTEAQRVLVDADELIAECEACGAVPEGAMSAPQSALFDRLKGMFALLKKILGGLFGGLFGAPATWEDSDE